MFDPTIGRSENIMAKLCPKFFDQFACIFDNSTLKKMLE